MKNFLSDCHGSQILVLAEEHICSRCGHFCKPLPTSEKINELIIKHSNKLTFYEHKNRFRLPTNSGCIGIDIKDLFNFDAEIIFSRKDGLITTMDFYNISFTYKNSEDELILVIDEETKNVIINEVEKYL